MFNLFRHETMLSIPSSRFCNSVCLSVKRTDERGSLGDDCLIALQHNPPQLLHRRRREAYFWSYPRMPGEYSIPGKILQLKFLAWVCVRFLHKLSVGARFIAPKGWGEPHADVCPSPPFGRDKSGPYDLPSLRVWITHIVTRRRPAHRSPSKERRKTVHF